ncbi:MAG: cytochrome P450 [Chloroflexi bacterium]|nr:cytochrome P450 [Chloroflexota bacterium]
MPAIPSDPNPDSSLALLADGYTFMAKRRRRLGSDIFVTRLMLRKATCIVGDEAAEFFYGGDRFTRQGAMPPTTVRLLQDKGSVQQLDGLAHRHRKLMFMSFMTPGSIQKLVDAMVDQWNSRIPTWESMDEVVLHHEVQEVLCRAVCTWAGIPLSEQSAKKRTREFTTMVDGSGTVFPQTVWGLLLRARNLRWAEGVISKIRSGHPRVPAGSPAHVIAWHRDLDGELLDTKIAAIELVNLLRPTVAVDRFVTFAALALHEHPECREQIVGGDGDALEHFVQEVRRYYPFFPFMGGRAMGEFSWRGHHLPRGSWVILDAYGTNHDPRIWDDPNLFRPERFRHWDGSAFNFIPQGGGDFATGHRCPGEWAAIELMKGAVRQLTTAMEYEVPLQDLSIDLSRMPAIPKSRFVIGNVRQIEHEAA